MHCFLSLFPPHPLLCTDGNIVAQLLLLLRASNRALAADYTQHLITKLTPLLSGLVYLLQEETLPMRIKDCAMSSLNGCMSQLNLF
jgi:hypothetical protein